MRFWMLAPLAAAVLVVPACDPGAPAVAPGAPVVAIPMRLVQKGVSPTPTLVEVKADGLILSPKGEFLGKLAGTKIVDQQGKELLSIAPDGTIVFKETQRKLKFNGDGDLTDVMGMVKIGSDGTVVVQQLTGDPNRTPLKFEGYTPVAHRAAELVIVLVAKHLGNVTDLGI